MEPRPLGSGFLDLLDTYPPGHHLHEIAEHVLHASRRCAARRAGVLKHPDLAARLPYTRPEQWNGWIPPATVNPGSVSEILRSPSGRMSFKNNRAVGEEHNDSPRRALLLEISAEAWERRNDEPG